MSIKRMAGTTLIELIVAIVIVGTALAGLVAAYNRANIASTDPLITQQMLAIAESMMEEVMQKPFVAQQNQAGRLFFNDLMDYNGYGPVAVSNVNGAPYYYTIGVSEYCKTANLTDCKTTAVGAAAPANYPYPA
ncbi:MAG: type II secretion system protein, partial [Oxalobacteraceae bacterium]